MHMRPQQASSAPAAPSAPVIAGTPTAPVAIPLSAIPQTAQEVQAVRIKIEDLRTQLQDFAERRNSVSSELRRADIDARPGYQARLANLDANINMLQNQITQATMALAQAPAQALVGGTSPQVFSGVPGGPRIPPDATRIVGIMGVVLVAIFAMGTVRAFFRRTPRHTGPVTLDRETSEQLRALQQSVDSIALEVERISESQRFVTKVFAGRDPDLKQAIPAQAQPIR